MYIAIEWYPMCLVLAIILSHREDPQTYTKLFYTLEAYRNTYAHAIIHPHNADFNQPLQFNSVEIDGDSENSDDDRNDVIIPLNT